MHFRNQVTQQQLVMQQVHYKSAGVRATPPAAYNKGGIRMAFVTGELENLLCDAINIIVDKKVESANYNKIIQGQIISNDLYGSEYFSLLPSGKRIYNTYKEHCYKVKYQDSIIIAYPFDEDKRYNKDDNIYLIIPNNDTRNPIFIIRRVPNIQGV